MPAFEFRGGIRREGLKYVVSLEMSCDSMQDAQGFADWLKSAVHHKVQSLGGLVVPAVGRSGNGPAKPG